MIEGSLLDALRARAAQRVCASGQPFALRPERTQDLPFAAELYAAIRREELAPVPWPDQAKRDFLRQQFEAQHRWYSEHYAGSERLIIESDGEAVGRFYLWAGPSEIRVMDVALMPAAQRRGIGTRLMRALCDVTGERGLAVTLHVEPNNPAQRLYARLGFERVEQRGVYDFLRWQGYPPETSERA